MKKYYQDFKRLLFKYYKVLLSVIFFFVLGCVGIYFVSTAWQDEVFLTLMQKVEEIQTSNLLLLFLRIFLNNFLVLVIIFISGFLYFPVYFLEFINGLAVALVTVKALQIKSWLVILLALLPHGILELPVFFIGSWLSILLWTKIYKSNSIEKDLTRWQFFKKIAVYFSLLTLLLLVAAFIEVFITPQVLKVFNINI